MKTYLAIPAIILGFAAPALAATAYDADGDGKVTLEEVQAVAPNVTEATFEAIDANGDGSLDEAEIADAEAAGVMPKS